MTDAVIKVENLSKRYRIGAREARYRTFRETLVDAARAPFQQMWKMVTPHSSPVTREPEMIWALKDVSFEANQGEVVGIIGRNGAGKSTLLKILSKITVPTRGRVELRGRIGSLLEIGTGFHPELTGHENIYLYGAVLGMDRWEVTRKFDEIVAFAELEKFVDTPVKKYSSGMYMRLAFAVAAHLEPEILLVDEVLAVGDAAFQKKCLGKMGDVSKEGRTILFVSHNMAAIQKLCSRAILLREGTKGADGPAAQVIRHYLGEIASETKAAVFLSPGSEDSGITSLRLHFADLLGNPQTQFSLNEKWRMSLDFELLKPLPHVIAAVGLISLDSTPIITYWSKAKDLVPGRYSVDFLCEVPLKACDLQFAVGITTNERSVYYVEDMGHVSISTVSLGEQPFRASGSGLLLSFQTAEIRGIDS